jgi:hypothetical protein
VGYVNAFDLVPPTRVVETPEQQAASGEQEKPENE